jgi:hypothetical protein
MPKQARAQGTNNSDNYDRSTGKPMTMDGDGHQHRMHAYKGEAPWLAPPSNESDATVFHAKLTDNADPQIRQFAGTINPGFSLSKDTRNEINVYLLLKWFTSFAKQTDAAFHIKPLNGSARSITNPSNIPTTKEGVKLYYQHRIVADGIRGEINVAMSKNMGDMKDLATPFSKYLDKETVDASRASLSLVDSRIIGVMFHIDPQLTFHDDIKTSILDIMRDDTPRSWIS